MRLALVLATFALACGGGGESFDPHELVACEPDSWLINGQQFTDTCELGCAAGPAGGIDADADGMADNCVRRSGNRCPVMLVADGSGVIGCCLPGDDGAGNMVMVFDLCE